MQTTKLTVRDLLKALVLVVLTAVIGGGLEGSSAYSQEVEQGDAETSDAEQEEESKQVRPTIDLGVFSVKDFRPSQNETVKLSFKIHLALDDSVNEKTVEQLKSWKHRLRNQVLVAIRISETIDFLEPDLHKFRRLISLRINRILKSILVSETMLTEYTFSTI